ncbi:hypothetical protein V2J09_001166 [Rumex salicifolius]
MDWHPKFCSSGSLNPGSFSIPTATIICRCIVGGGNSGVGTWREKELRRVDRELARENNKSALKIVKRMQGKPGGLRGFGAAKQVPYAKYVPEYLDGVDMSYIQPRVDSMLELVIKSIQSAFQEGSPPGSKSITLSSELLHRRAKQHEAGHFMVAYLLGILPRAYHVPSIPSTEEKPTRGLVEMVDFASPLDGTSVKLSSKSLNKFSCIALGGLAAAYIEYGYTGGFVSDVDKMLLRHRIATLNLADAMALGKSIGCFKAMKSLSIS